nr:MAG TPA: hypothetical protein [Caudoviricetes sp.]
MQGYLFGKHIGKTPKLINLYQPNLLYKIVSYSPRYYHLKDFCISVY